MQAIVIAVLVLIGQSTIVEGTGGNTGIIEQCERVAVVSDRTGDVLYYNCK